MVAHAAAHCSLFKWRFGWTFLCCLDLIPHYLVFQDYVVFVVNNCGSKVTGGQRVVSSCLLLLNQRFSLQFLLDVTQLMPNVAKSQNILAPEVSGRTERGGA